jgi:hypothetical protein
MEWNTLKEHKMETRRQPDVEIKVTFSDEMKEQFEALFNGTEDQVTEEALERKEEPPDKDGQEEIDGILATTGPRIP